MRITQKLVNYIHGVFNKDPIPFLAFRINCDGTGLTWRVLDASLTLTPVGGTATQLTIDLTAYTINSLAAYINTQTGYSVSDLNTTLYASLGARTLLDSNGDIGISNGDRLYGYASELWSYMDAQASELEAASTQLNNMLLQMSTNTAEDVWLDELGGYYNVPRLQNETDLSYGPRIIAQVIRPLANNVAIESALRVINGNLPVSVTDYDTLTNNSYGLFDINVDVSLEMLDITAYTSFLLSIVDTIDKLRDAGTFLRRLAVIVTGIEADYYSAGVVVCGETVNISLDWLGHSLFIDFTSGVLDPRITFARASSATRFNASGILETVGSNVPRFDYDPLTLAPKGLLIEEARTNLVLSTGNLSGSYWSRIGSRAIPQLDGSTLLIEGTTTGGHLIYSTAINFVAGNTYTLSVDAKLGPGARNISLRSNNGAIINFDIRVNLSNGSTVLGSGTVKAIGGGWWNIQTTATAASTASANIGFQIAIGDANPNYTGDNTSGFYIKNPQCEPGSFATSRIQSNDTFTSRASTATFIGSNGKIQTAAENVARMQYNPLNLSVAPNLLLEAAATNLLTYSEQFDNAAWVKINATISANAVAAPDGNLTADKIVEAAITNGHFMRQSFSFVSGVTYTYSIFVKASERSVFVVDLPSSAFTSATIWFNLANGVVSKTAGASVAKDITPIGNGWYRISVTATCNSSSSTNIDLYLDNSPTGSTFYAGDGVSGAYVWGAQLEVGSYATSYIATANATATRAADISTSTAGSRAADTALISTLSPWFNVSAGSIISELSINSATAGTTRTVFDGGTANSQAYISSSNALTFNAAGKTSISGNIKIAVAYSAAASIACASGVIGTSGNTGAPTFSYLRLGYNRSGGEYFNNCIKKISYYPILLTNAQLQFLTT